MKINIILCLLIAGFGSQAQMKNISPSGKTVKKTIDIGQVTVDTLMLGISASNKVRLHGKVEYLNAKLNASNLDLPALEVKQLDVESRASMLKVDVVKKIRINGNKAGNLFYKSRPDLQVVILDQPGVVKAY